MSIRYTTANRPSSRSNNLKQISSRVSKLLISRPKITSQIQNIDLNEIFGFPKSPVGGFHKQQSFAIHRKKSYNMSNNSPSSVVRAIQNYKKKSKKRKQTSIQKPDRMILGFSSSRRPENCRYKERTLEECESFNHLNGVSTPPDEDPVYDRSISPFSDIIEEDLKNYINQASSKLSKLELPKKSFGYIEDSFQYSTAESRKRESYKFSFEKNAKTPEPPKTPPPLSIYSKITNYRNHKKL